MARPTKAAERTAYDLGRQHGRDDTPGGPPDWVNTTELMAAYDDGLATGTDELDTASQIDSKVKPPRHRAAPRSTARKTTASRSATRKPAGGRRQGFSHPARWGSGARGHTVGRPTLRPPRGLSSRDWTGFGFGLVLYALGAAYIKYGRGGPTKWLRAKFLNETGDNAATINTNPQQLRKNGYIAPHAKGYPTIPKTGGGDIWVQGSDGLWYPATPKAGQLKVPQ